MSTAGLILDHVSGKTLPIDVGQNVCFNLNALQTLGTLDSLDHDLLRLASYIYAADLGVKRSEREQHLRSITVTVPVVNLQAFERNRSSIESALTTLSCDNWNLNFTQSAVMVPAVAVNWPGRGNSTLMFSGGLDSFAGAAKLLQSEAQTFLVSHTTRNRPVKVAQEALAASVNAEFSNKGKHIQIRVSLRNFRSFTFPSDDDREDTQRTRSFLFCSLSAIVAHLTRTERIVVMAENGQFAIHLPLTEARAGAFSTHTAHPKFLSETQEIFRELFLCKDLEILNPFLYSTKGEVVNGIPETLRDKISKSVSCWRASRIPTRFSHCGECVPCLCRRVALESNGIVLKEYERDLLKENIGALKSDDRGKRNLIDLCQFISFFGGPNSISLDQEVCYQFPELFDSNLDATKAIGMYRRFAKEALAVLGKYRNVKNLMK